jgi:fucose permease
VLSGSLVLLVLWLHPELGTAQALILAQMFFAGSSWGVINPLLFEFAPVRLRSVAASVALAVSSVGSTFLSSQLIGLVSDRAGLRVALFLVPLGYFVAALIWLALALGQRRRSGEPRREPLPGAFGTA